MDDIRTLECVGKGGKKTRFLYHYEKHNTDGVASVQFYVYTNEEAYRRAEYFFMMLRDYAGYKSSLIVKDITHRNSKELSQKGIPDALIPKAARLLKRNIVSSVMLNPDSDGYPNDKARKLWRRLVKKGRASFATKLNRYICKYR